MKKSNKLTHAAFAVFISANMLMMTGCGTAEDTYLQTDLEEMSVDLVAQQEAPKVWADDDAAETQKDGLPYPQDRELAEDIDSNLPVAISTDGWKHWTQEEVDEENLQERAALEEKVKAADGISEEEAVEIAKKAMETDLGEKAKALKLHEAEQRYGWKAYLWDITDWQEYQDKGEIGYSIQFDNVEQIGDLDDLFAYHCMVNAIDGSICGAYSGKGLFGDNDIWYEH